jgi:UV DNA damage endonuclease
MNLECLQFILEYNLNHGFYFFRIGSNLVPFASHPICNFDWGGHFQQQFKRIGRFIREHNMRITMHPDQFTLLNSPKRAVVQRSIAELLYHVRVFALMELEQSAKIQIHVGGVYGAKKEAKQRFINQYQQLPVSIKRHLVIENDDRLYSLKDCLSINNAVGVPVILDVFHHECLNNSEPLRDAISKAASTWNLKDGPLIVHYSSQEPGAKIGKHASSIDLNAFREFLKKSSPQDFDIMLEIKDKERSALLALDLLNKRESMN